MNPNPSPSTSGDELPNHVTPFDDLTDDVVDVHLPDAIDIHDRWQRQLALGSPYHLEVAAAVERWQQEHDTLRDLRSWGAEYKAALSRNDHETASRIWCRIQDAKAVLRSIRKG